LGPSAGEDRPWTILEPTPGDSLPAVLEVFGYCANKSSKPLTIRQAKYVARLYKLIPDKKIIESSDTNEPDSAYAKELWEIASDYAGLEQAVSALGNLRVSDTVFLLSYTKTQTLHRIYIKSKISALIDELAKQH
jgi:hypothetical protein